MAAQDSTTQRMAARGHAWQHATDRGKVAYDNIEQLMATRDHPWKLMPSHNGS